MRSFLVVLATMALATCVTAENELIKNILGTEFGGPHGKPFSDQEFAQAGQQVLSVSIQGMKRVDRVNITVSYQGERHTFAHGGTGGEAHSLTLGHREHVNKVEWYTDKHRGRTRVFYLRFETNHQNSISAGTKSGNAGSEIAPRGYQLGGFEGAAGDEVDRLRMIWTCIDITIDQTCHVP